MFLNSMLKIDNFLTDYKKYIILFFILCLYIPFINLPSYYDDEHRFTTNIIGLIEQGRIIPDLWYRIITSSRVADVYVLNLVFCALFSLILFKIQYFKDNYFLFIIVFSNSFFIENLSYHVDVIGMFVAFTLGIYAAFYENDNHKKMFFVSFVLALISILCYQSSLNIFSTSVLVALVLDYFHKKNNFIQYLKIRFLVFLGALISIKVILYATTSLLTIPTIKNYFFFEMYRVEYIEKRSSVDIFAFPKQFLDFIDLMISSFNYTQYFLILICLIIIIFNFKYTIYSVFSLMICFFLLLFPYVFVDNKWLVQPRVLYGFSGLLLMIYVWAYYSYSSIKIKTLVNLIFLTYSFIFLSSVSAYVNSYKLAIELESNVYQKIHTLINPIEPVVLQRCGYNSMVFDAKYVKTNATSYPIIYNIIRTPRTHWTERSQGIYDMYNLNFIAEYCIFSPDQTINNLILNDKYFNLYKTGDNSYRMIYK